MKHHPYEKDKEGQNEGNFADIPSEAYTKWSSSLTFFQREGQGWDGAIVGIFQCDFGKGIMFEDPGQRE